MGFEGYLEQTKELRVEGLGLRLGIWGLGFRVKTLNPRLPTGWRELRLS